MRFRFTIFDRNNIGTLIKEPVGWDASELIIEREKETHGLFFSYGNDAYQYQGVAAKILNAEYETCGAQGVKTLLIEEECNGDYEELYHGKFLFTQYQRLAGDDCGVTCPVEALGDIMTFRNRIDQKVSLDTVLGFDTTTALVPYAGLNKTITLPGKAVFAEDKAYNLSPNSVEAIEVNYNPGENLHAAMFTPPYDTKVFGEIGGFNPSGPEYIYDWPISIGGGAFVPPADWVHLNFNATSTGGPLGDLNYFPLDVLDPIINYDASLGNAFGPNPQPDFTIEVRTSATFVTNYNSGNPVATRTEGGGYYLFVIHADNSFQWLSDNIGFPPSGVINFSVINNVTIGGGITITGYTLRPGDRIYMFGIIFYNKDSRYAADSPFFMSGNEQINDDNIFRLSGLTRVPDSLSKVYLINEAISRTAEAITNDRIRLYSDYFGRTDSQPYTVVADGEGSRACITNGKFIRRLNEIRPGQPPQLNISIQDWFDGLNPIHNLGMGIEPDPNRTGFNRLRIENWRHFYQDEIVLECIGVNNLRIQSQEKEYYSKFKFGYSKWEAEEFNGIDEFLTDREYRTDLEEVNNTLTMLSSFILSGYALEVTRRKGNEKSEDWRYDNDFFMVALKRDGSDLVVEQGGILTPANIIDPETIYNFRYSPMRIAMKWLPEVLKSYRIVDAASKITFTDGTGNYYAEGEQDTTFYKIEDGVIVENQLLTLPDLDDVNVGRPRMRPERAVFDFPMNIKTFRQLQANPNGRIYYDADGVTGSGWIDKFQYEPWEGIGHFTLIPKI